ncbi:MAG: hypothetical protein ACKVQK_20050 [Burkholderiales bacterium]
MARNFARWAPNRTTAALTAIKTTIMSQRDAWLWDRDIQPAIYRRLDRADRYWSWSVLRQVFPLLQRLRHRRCAAYVTFVRNALGQAIPAAMHLFIERYPDIAKASPESDTVFVWFISSSPADVLVQLNVPEPPKLGRICIDTALVCSENLGTRGRIGLHCAIAGGDPLLRFYESACGLYRLHESIRLPESRRNDGRYFHADEALASRMLSELDTWRT